MAHITNTWPLGLPQSPLLEGFDEQPQPNVIRTGVDAGRARQRKRYTSAGAVFNCSFIFDTAQRATFDAFFKNTLGNGASEFNWVHPITDEPIVARFIGDSPPRFTILSHNRQHMNAQIEVTYINHGP